MQNEELSSKTNNNKSAKKNKSVIDANLIFTFDRKSSDSLQLNENFHPQSSHKYSKSKAKYNESTLKSIFFQSKYAY